MRDTPFDVHTPLADFLDHEMEASVVADKYLMGLEPLENWAEEDLLRFRAAIETELSERSDAIGNR